MRDLVARVVGRDRSRAGTVVVGVARTLGSDVPDRYWRDAGGTLRFRGEQGIRRVRSSL